MEYTTANLAIIVIAVFLGGLVKGVFGLGLPFVATSILAMFFGVPAAIALMLIPVLLSNLWQAWQGGFVRQFKRYWPLIVLLIPGSWVGTEFLVVADQRTLILLMGGSLGGFGLLQLAGFRLRLSPGQEVWVSPLAGFLSGVIGGITFFFGLIVSPFLISLNLERDDFVGAIGMIYTFCALIMLGALASRGMIGLETSVLSTVLCVPIFGAMAIGMKIRRRLKTEVFYRSVFMLLTGIGGSLIVRGLML
jgi:hypothetical protein